MTENEISKIVLDSDLKVHKTLKNSLLESDYEECRFYEIQKNRFKKAKALSLNIRITQV